MPPGISGNVDGHVHLSLDDGMRVGQQPHGIEEYSAEAGAHGIGAAAILAMAPAGDLERTRVQNDLVLGADLGGIRALPLCSVHPTEGDAALAEVDRVAAEGAAGFKLHPNTQQFDVAHEGVAAVVRRAGEHGLPVLFDGYSPTDPAQLGKFLELAMACPESRIVLAHLNGPRFVEMLLFDIVAKYDWWPRHVWFDLSATVAMFGRSPFAEQSAWVCRQLGTDRILFGSDYPLVPVGEALDATRALGFTEAELEQVLRANATALYGLDPVPASSGRSPDRR